MGPAEALPGGLAEVTGRDGQRREAQQQKRGKKNNGNGKKSSAARSRVRKLLRSGDYGLAREMIRTAMKTNDRDKRDAWRIVRVELEYAQRKYARAGLEAMRIVILRPKSRQHGTALFWAAKSHEGLGRPGTAQALYEACVEHETTKRSLREKAAQRLAFLSKDGPTE